MPDFADFATPVELPKPRPLQETQRAEPYPVECLPPVIRDAICEVASYVQAPTAMIAASAVAAVSTAVQTRYSVRRDAALCGPASLYFLTVAESGERKSTVDRVFTGPIRDWEAEQRKISRERHKQYAAEMKAWESQDYVLKQNMASGGLSALLGTDRDPSLAHALAKPQEPPAPVRMLRGDDTQEALAMALERYPVASIMSAEAGVIFGSHSMRAEGVTANLAQANVMWDGGVIQRDRVGSGEVQVEGMRVTMGLQVQPAVLASFVQKTGGLAKGIGYFARFLFSQPESTQGARFYVDPPAAQPAVTAFYDRLTTLLREEAVFDEYGRLAPRYIAFDALAQKTWVGFHDEVEEQLQDDEQYAGIKDVASKAADNAARLACCLHVFQHGPTAIGIDAMLAACKLMRWYLDEAVRFSPGRIDLFVVTLIDGRVSTFQPIMEYDDALAKARAFHRDHPRCQIKVLPMSGPETFNLLGIKPLDVEPPSPVERRQMVDRLMQIARDSGDPEARREAFDLLRDMGVVKQ